MKNEGNTVMITVCKMLGTSISSVLTDFFLVLLFARVLVATTTCGRNDRGAGWWCNGVLWAPKYQLNII